MLNVFFGDLKVVIQGECVIYIASSTSREALQHAVARIVIGSLSHRISLSLSFQFSLPSCMWFFLLFVLCLSVWLSFYLTVLFLPPPPLVVFCITQLAPSVPWLSCIVPLLVVILTMHVGDFYLSSVCSRHLPVSQFSRWSTGAAFTSSLLAASFWNAHGAASSGHFYWPESLPPVTTSHALSGGVLFSYGFFLLCEYLLWFLGDGSELCCRW